MSAAQQVVLAPIAEKRERLVQAMQGVLVAAFECVDVSDIYVGLCKLPPVAHLSKMFLRGRVVVSRDLELAQVPVGPPKAEIAAANGCVVIGLARHPHRLIEKGYRSRNVVVE